MMNDDLMLQHMRSAVDRLKSQAPDEWFAEMVRNGIMNEKGEVLIRMSEPPEWLTSGAKQRANGNIPEKNAPVEHVPAELNGVHRENLGETPTDREALVRLAPDVAAAFPTDEAVNCALRMLMQLSRQQVPPTG
jgi:hypothetical protein